MYFSWSITVAVVSLLFGITPAYGAPTTCSSRGISAASAAAVAAAFTKAKLIPQAITTPIQPKLVVNVAYGSHQVNLGNNFSIAETVSNAPSISIGAETDYDPATTKYLILFVDPDAPSPTSSGAVSSLSFVLQEAVANASPNCINAANNGGGTVVTVPGYRGTTPLSVASHRYTFLVYRQPPGWTAPASLSTALLKFDLNGFVKSNNLVLVGGNFFLEGIGTSVS